MDNASSSTAGSAKGRPKKGGAGLRQEAFQRTRKTKGGGNEQTPAIFHFQQLRENVDDEAGDEDEEDEDEDGPIMEKIDELYDDAGDRRQPEQHDDPPLRPNMFVRRTVRRENLGEPRPLPPNDFSRFPGSGASPSASGSSIPPIPARPQTQALASSQVSTAGGNALPTQGWEEVSGLAPYSQWEPNRPPHVITATNLPMDMAEIAGSPPSGTSTAAPPPPSTSPGGSFPLAPTQPGPSMPVLPPIVSTGNIPLPHDASLVAVRPEDTPMTDHSAPPPVVIQASAPPAPGWSPPVPLPGPPLLPAPMDLDPTLFPNARNAVTALTERSRLASSADESSTLLQIALGLDSVLQATVANTHNMAGTHAALQVFEQRFGVLEGRTRTREVVTPQGPLKRRNAKHPGLPISRAEAENELNEVIRDTVLGLFKINKGDPLPIKPENVDRPTPNLFFIDFGKTSGWPFNQIAIDVIVEEVTKKVPNLAAYISGKVLRTKVTKHTEHLSNLYWKQTNPPTPQEAADTKEQHNNNGRKRTSFIRRLTTTDRDNEVNYARPLVLRLGPRGMSSDEEGLRYVGPGPQRRGRTRKGTKTFQVRPKFWLAPWVTNVMERLDVKSLEHAKTVYQHGSLPRPRERIPDTPPSTNPEVVKGLWINCYHPRFLALLDETQKRELEADPTPFPIPP